LVLRQQLNVLRRKVPKRVRLTNWASDESRTMTGQSINCDAGAVMVG
jgi:hypothetical protein